MKIKVNDFVILKKQAVEEFYGRPERIEDFSSFGDLDHLTSEELIQFIDMYLGFENGKACGIVVNINKDTAKVLYQNTIRDGLDFSFYDLKDLKEVKLNGILDVIK